MSCAAEVTRPRGDGDALLSSSSQDIKQVVWLLTTVVSVLQGAAGSDVPPCQHPEEVWDRERGQGGHLHDCVPIVCGSHAGLCQDWCRSHRDLRWIQCRVLSWEDHGL